MFVLITERGEKLFRNVEDVIATAKKRIEAGYRLVMIETPQGFIVNVEELEAYQATLENN